jgi:hypothetical protein
VNKQPAIRPGQKTPYVKGTRKQIDERVEFVARMMAARAYKAEIHRAVREKFNIGWRQCDRYMARALFYDRVNRLKLAA